MFHFRFITIFAIPFCAIILWRGLPPPQNPAHGPSDVVRAFYQAMHERRFKEAWALTIYKPAVDGLNAQEMEDLRPDFEEKAAAIPDQVEISGQQISGDIATVFVKVPVSESTPQNVSQPVNLIKSGAGWIIGTEADQVEVKKKGRRFCRTVSCIPDSSD